MRNIVQSVDLDFCSSRYYKVPKCMPFIEETVNTKYDIKNIPKFRLSKDPLVRKYQLDWKSQVKKELFGSFKSVSANYKIIKSFNKV